MTKRRRRGIAVASGGGLESFTRRRATQMPANIHHFIAFRLLFNARFYYPVFAVLQLDYGLTLAQFALLNAVWAVSIVALEVPSGALADRFGRKRMVVAASVLMVMEMALIAFVPLGDNSVVFTVWIINRILSGAAEASASGADEALAYDSIPPEQRAQLWPRVLTRLMTLSSLGFVVAMLVGAAVFDETLLNRLLAATGFDLRFDKETVIRFPIYLTLCNAVLATIVALGMIEPSATVKRDSGATLWSGMAGAGAWILRTPVALLLILAALVFDSPVRLLLTLNSEYYRLIQIPDAWFGLIGAMFAGLGMLVPRLAVWLVACGKPGLNYALIAALIFTGFLGVSRAWPVAGVGVMILFSIGFGLLNFFTSHHLNAVVDSNHRATVLSFKGLALNLGFGTVSLLYGTLLRSLRQGEDATAVRDAFRESLYWMPWAFLLAVVLLALVALRVRTGARKNPGNITARHSL